ncbi:hypothetical protein P171DRAFT_424929 [Karstenula rhodostoma CBS 690.94]|uniref:Heterokaryon incompatibility domain-containing protein n=1 Tax=Karstenula rhodostoma CBS 690.94 TaxID=1392251 RepID=A0A9P4P5X3_9PLEO|nr:hypothetical protein P171DRAFT_424929 [Karstenula rhodostoma CBS 690.94]
MDLYTKLSPLEDGQIRLLQVSQCSNTSEISCALTVVSLRSQPSYFALSYTWGSPFPNYSERQDTSADLAITCNGVKIPVKPNLYDFLLRCARHPDSSYRERLWVDAVCINQKNHLERSKQVQLIGDIYKLAARVVVWLGVEDDTTAEAVELMREFAATEPAVLLRLQFPAASQDPLSDSRHWHAVARFFERNWCASDADAEFANSVRTRRVHFPAKLAATKASKLSSSGDGLLYALIRSRVSKCEDTRDKLYSQLKLGNADIFPTYDDDEAQVYITAATYILQHSDNLLLLTCVEGSDFQNISNLPSWVPDWSVTKDLGLRITGYRHFTAAGSLPRTVTVLNGGRVLQIQAARIDSITSSAETKGEILDFSRPTRLWAMLAHLDDIYAPTGQSKEEYPALGSPLRESFAKWILWRYLAAARKSPFLESSSFPAPGSSESTLPSREAILALVKQASPEDRAAVEKDASMFHSHYSHALFVRPFRTREGFLGLGTQSLRDGDGVWVVPGCRVPLILRRVEGSQRYRLVGGTVLHGFMNGEALERDGVDFDMVELE